MNFKQKKDKSQNRYNVEITRTPKEQVQIVDENHYIDESMNSPKLAMETPDLPMETPSQMTDLDPKQVKDLLNKVNHDNSFLNLSVTDNELIDRMKNVIEYQYNVIKKRERLV